MWTSSSSPEFSTPARRAAALAFAVCLATALVIAVFASPRPQPYASSSSSAATWLLSTFASSSSPTNLGGVGYSSWLVGVNGWELEWKGIATQALLGGQAWEGSPSQRSADGGASSGPTPKVTVLMPCRDPDHGALVRAVDGWRKALAELGPHSGEVVVVDWSSKAKLDKLGLGSTKGAWWSSSVAGASSLGYGASSVPVHVARIEGEERWVGSRANNVAARIASGRVLIKPHECAVGPGNNVKELLAAAEQLHQALVRSAELEVDKAAATATATARPNAFFYVGSVTEQSRLFGLAVVAKRDWDAAFGFDERIQLPGFADEEFFARLELVLHMERRVLPHGVVEQGGSDAPDSLTVSEAQLENLNRFYDSKFLLKRALASRAVSKEVNRLLFDLVLTDQGPWNDIGGRAGSSYEVVEGRFPPMPNVAEATVPPSPAVSGSPTPPTKPDAEFVSGVFSQVVATTATEEEDGYGPGEATSTPRFRTAVAPPALQSLVSEPMLLERSRKAVEVVVARGH